MLSLWADAGPPAAQNIGYRHSPLSQIQSTTSPCFMRGSQSLSNGDSGYSGFHRNKISGLNMVIPFLTFMKSQL